MGKTKNNRFLPIQEKETKNSNIESSYDERTLTKQLSKLFKNNEKAEISR